MTGESALTEDEAAPALRDVLTPVSTSILAIVLVNQATAYLVMPFLALYLRQRLHLGIPVTGVLVGLPFLSALVFGLVGGAVADRVGLFRSFVGALIVYSLAIGSIAFLHTVGPLAIVLVIGGAVRPTVTTSLQGLANGSVPSEWRGTIQNALYWAANLGVVVGLLVSAELLRGGLSSVPFLVLAAVGLVVAAAAAAFLGAGLHDAAPQTHQAPALSLRHLLRAVVSDSALLLGALSMALVVFVEAQTSSTMPLDLAARMHGAGHLYGPLLAIDAVAVLALTPLAMRYLEERPAVWVFAIGAVLSAAGLAVGGAIDTTVVWLAAMVVYSVGEVLWVIKLNDLLGQLPGSANAGLYFAAIMMAQNLGAFAGASGGTVVFHSLGRGVLFPGMIVVAVAASFAFRGAVRALRLRVQRQSVEAQAVTVAALPGIEIVGQSDDQPLRAVGAEDLFQGAAAFHPGGGEFDPATFDIPAPPERLVFLSDLPEADWRALWSRTERMVFAPWEVVVQKGSEDRALYIVRRGHLAVVVARDGEERNLTVIPPGSVFGEQSFADGRPRSASIRALSEAEVHRLDWDAFNVLVTEDPALAGAVMAGVARVLSERLRLTTALVGRLAR